MIFHLCFCNPCYKHSRLCIKFVHFCPQILQPASCLQQSMNSKIADKSRLLYQYYYYYSLGAEPWCEIFSLIVSLVFFTGVSTMSENCTSRYLDPSPGKVFTSQGKISFTLVPFFARVRKNTLREQEGNHFFTNISTIDSSQKPIVSLIFQEANCNKSTTTLPTTKDVITFKRELITALTKCPPARNQTKGVCLRSGDRDRIPVQDYQQPTPNKDT